jgi:hypothetical protein
VSTTRHPHRVGDVAGRRPAPAVGRPRRARGGHAALLLVVIAAAACRGDAPGAQPANRLEPELAAPATTVTLTGQSRAFVDSVRSTEARRIEQTDGLLRRVSIDRLWFLPDEAEPMAFDDQLDGEIMLLHVFRSRLPPGYSLIEVIRMEGGLFLLVDERTGERFEIDEMPAVSPDGERFATASFDVVAGHMPNRLVIYRFTDAGPQEEWSLAPHDWGPSDAAWLDDRTLRFLRNDLDMTVQPFRITQTERTALLTPGGWRLVE